MADRALIHSRRRGIWLILIALLGVGPVDLVAAWTVDMSAAAAHLGGPSTYTFATLAEAQAFVNANSNYGARLVPGGSDSVAGGLPAAGVFAGNLPNLTAQQQQALQAVQAVRAALPILQNAAQTIFAAAPKVQAPSQSQSQDQIATQQLYNSGVWYMRKKDYANALVEFQKALARSPGNRVIMGRIAEAQRLLDQTAGNNAAANSMAPPVALPSAARSALNLIDLGPGSDVVDLRGATKTSVDPAAMKAGSGHDPGSPVPDTHEAAARAEEPHNRGAKEQLEADFDQLYRDAIKTPPQPKGPGAP